MKFYGDANLQKNELQNAVLTTLNAFPSEPKVGQLAFLNSRVYICVQISPAPAVWVPLTQEITAYNHTQASAASTWNINHGLNTTSVNVQIFDGSDEVIIPNSIAVLDANSVRVTLSTSMAGRATVVTGHFDGNPKPTYAYTHQQGSASATWTINHNLGYNPIVRVFIGTDEVQPESISHPTLNQTVITFTTAKVGYAKLI